MASVLKGKRPGQYILPEEGKVVELVEQAENDFYDTVQVPNGAIAAGRQFKLFDVVSSKFLQHSSFTTPHKLIGIDEFTLQSIGIAICQSLGATTAVGNDYLLAAWALSLEFTINRRQIVQGPISLFQAGVGVTGGTGNTAAAAVTNASFTNGVPSTAAIRKLKVEQPIVGEVDVVDGVIASYDNAWLTGGSSPITIATAAPGVGIMFVGHGIEKNGLGK
jgi:hypothetical protein